MLCQNTDDHRSSSEGLSLEEAAKRRALVHQYMPELLVLLKELHELGMFQGWSMMGEVRLLGANLRSSGPNGSDPTDLPGPADDLSLS